MLAALTNEQDVTGGEQLDVVVVRLPRLSNFTDFDPLMIERGVAVRFVDHPSAFGDPDLVVVPGTKSTVADLQWLRTSGLLGALNDRWRSPSPPVVLGICGGFQMLGHSIVDTGGVESIAPSSDGLGWLPLVTNFEAEKTTRLRSGTGPTGAPVRGYEIRHGRSMAAEGWEPWLSLESGDPGYEVESAQDTSASVYGTSLHGLFEEDGFRADFLRQVAVARGKAWEPSGASFGEARERQIDSVADACAAHLDTDALWRLVELGATG
jgi:adenosylcobyric acid synthase